MAVFLFDLDMTLVDSSGIETLRRYKLWKQVYRNLHFIRPFDVESGPAPHELPAQLKAKGHTVGVVTSSPREYAERVLEMFHVPYETLVAYHDTEEHKPDPEPLDLARKQLRAKKSETYYVGDDEIDVQASYSAGVTSIGVAWGGRQWCRLQSAPDILLHDTKLILKDSTLARRGFLADIVPIDPLWHRGSVLRHCEGPPGFSLGRYFSTDDPRHKKLGLSPAILILKDHDKNIELFGELLATALTKELLLDSYTYVVAVPPKPGQTRNRYTKILEAMMERVDENRCSIYPDGLQCVKDYGDLKTKGGFVDRSAAVRGAFRSKYRWSNHRVVLIDDVSTTGATAIECARALKNEGAGEVVRVSLGKDQQTFIEMKCPQCGSKMKIRTAKKGPYAGSRFWGCSGFPDCRHIVNF